MRIIDIPAPVVFEGEGSSTKPFMFGDFLVAALGTYEPFGTFEKMDRAAVVRKAIREMNGTLCLEDADYADVLAACRLAKFNPQLAHLLVPFKAAILKAQDVQTQEKK